MRERRMASTTLRVAVDVSGTFTDICTLDTETGNRRRERPSPYPGLAFPARRSLSERSSALSRADRAQTLR
jgi:N-methylhydantoinase A/oxoprolinase/acetone carboxylase beta subunit